MKRLKNVFKAWLRLSLSLSCIVLASVTPAPAQSSGHNGKVLVVMSGGHAFAEAFVSKLKAESQ